MPEPTDAVLPILKRIQVDLAQTRRELGKTLEGHGDRLESIERYLTYELGLTTRAKVDIQSFKAELKAIKKRVAALERSSPRRGSK